MPVVRSSIDDFLEHEFETRPCMASDLGLTAVRRRSSTTSRPTAMRQRDADAANVA